MVRDFPDSTPALLDLRLCLARTGRSTPLVVALKEQIARRLLIAGAHTRISFQPLSVSGVCSKDKVMKRDMIYQMQKKKKTRKKDTHKPSIH